MLVSRRKILILTLFVIIIFVFLIFAFQGSKSNCLNDVIFVTENLNWPRSCSILEAKSEVDCQDLWRKSDDFLSEEQVQHRVSNCTSIGRTKLEAEDVQGPLLAYSIVAHNQIGLLESLLVSIFRPQNSYCIFVDAKATSRFKSHVKALIQCYKSNYKKATIFEPIEKHAIYWSDFSLLKADFVCMKELLKRNKKWSYFINQAGTVMPQMEVEEATLHFSQLEGQDSVFSMPFPKRILDRIKYKYKRPKGNDWSFRQNPQNSFIYGDIPRPTKQLKEPPPFGLKIYKGYREVVLSRKSVKFHLRSNLSQALANWSQDISFPEEIFFSTLHRVNFSHYFKHALVDQNQEKKVIPYVLCPRRTLWNYASKHCYGQSKRWMCNLSLKDLVEAQEAKCLFINKFDLQVDTRPITCLRQHFISHQ